MTHDDVLDTETLSVNAFKEEGAFLHQAGLAAASLTRRLCVADPRVTVFRITRDELEGWAYQLTRAVAVASEYHCDASEPTA